MFEAGRRSFAALSSNNTRPVSSEATLMPTIAGSSSVFLKILEILFCSSESVLVVVAALEDPTAVVEGETCGTSAGLDSSASGGEGFGPGVEVGKGVGVGVTL
jgi:hypothetical protein